MADVMGCVVIQYAIILIPYKSIIFRCKSRNAIDLKQVFLFNIGVQVFVEPGSEVFQEFEISCNDIYVSYFGNPDIYQNVSGLGSINSKGEHK